MSVMLRNMALLLFTLFSWRAFAASDITYCSSVNTGASNSANVSVYQSNGLCTDTCNSDYAFGILQGKSCWCSNIAPNKATNVDTTKCDTGCPGYPDDSCGSASKGVFAYIQMNLHSPSGTATVSSSTSTSTTESSTKSTDSSKTTEAPTTSSTQSIETVAGEVKTITVPNAKPTADSSAGMSEKDSSSSSGLSGGAIAGVVVGSLGGLAAIIAIFFLIFFKKRQARSTSPSPSVSNGLLDGRNSKGSQMSVANRAFSDTHSHTLSAGSSRLPTFTDTRLKTDTVLYAGGRRDSDVSLQDNEDYSRPVLRLTNPD
ncbi:ER membrane protein (Wsc4) [Aspergillus nomiae NRRL 13137]|uniref:ER membrane protein (Wsc4) n=1 Tax=Aspergillus nomiae NRRL (strain ATCC 15546 / NRRL 13137 / CBS 260.88 / M93) TaxID=1509407 RepID=A0A0L1JGI3_ASPN3|nr:ER membrane protein (Wsc4) [Aspergillus nomiae NRRL 13137]KNG90473.1 ER membrane protein (Wsc4) [Aspergillus nomiae NRRL 13137]